MVGIKFKQLSSIEQVSQKSHEIVCVAVVESVVRNIDKGEKVHYGERQIEFSFQVLVPKRTIQIIQS